MADFPVVAQTEDLPPRRTTRTSPSSSHSRRSHSEPRVARRTVSSPRASPYPTHTTATSNTSARARHRAEAHRWSWLPSAIATWRIEEEIEIPTEIGEFSPMDLSPYTQEPIHLTVPVLAARLHRHETRLGAMEFEQHETRLGWMHLAQGRVAQIYQDQEDLAETMEIVHQQVIDDRGEVDALQARLEQCEIRSQEAEQYSRMLEQRLTVAEENVRQAGRLAEAVDHLISLLPQVNLHQD